MSEYQGRAIRYEEQHNFPAFNILLICVPVSIDNSLPSTDAEFGADAAPNTITDAIDKIKQSTHRCFVIKIIGSYCGCSKTRNIVYCVPPDAHPPNCYCLSRWLSGMHIFGAA